jgi:hypothetical protein
MQSISSTLKNSRLKRGPRNRAYWEKSIKIVAPSKKEKKTENSRHVTVCCHSHFRLIVKLISCVESFGVKYARQMAPYLAVSTSKARWSERPENWAADMCYPSFWVVTALLVETVSWICHIICHLTNGTSKKFFHCHMLLKKQLQPYAYRNFLVWFRESNLILICIYCMGSKILSGISCRMYISSDLS